ncbi:MAG: LptF/LptG family permease [Bdellovibrionota bacterium]|nr:LptF/LptG family permease [Bdellovibrionota bacterium]
MHIFSRMVLNEWLRAFGTTLFVLFSIIFVGNIVSEFLRDAASTQDIFQNFALEVPKWMEKVVPISCLGATLFSIYRLKMTNALISLFALGFKRSDYIKILFFLSLFVGSLQLLVGGYIKPYARSLRKDWLDKDSHFRGYKKGGVRARTIASGLIWYKGKNYFSHFSYYDREKKSLNKFSSFQFDDQGGLSRIVRANFAIHQKETTWKLVGVEVYDNLNKKRFPTVSVHKELMTELGEKPTEFDSIESDVHELGMDDLYDYVKKVDGLGIEAAEFDILFFEKISTPFICFVFTFLPIAGLFYPNRRAGGLGKSVIFLLVFTFAFWFLYSSLLTMGSNGKVTPMLATFGLPVLCLFYILLTLLRHRKLTE